jgi:hypothetical protein
MAQTTELSVKELERQADLVFGGKTAYAMLCSPGFSNFTAASTVAQWQTVEVTGNGYTRKSAPLLAGSYDTTLGLFRIPDVDFEFTSTGAGYFYDRVILYLSDETYIHSMITESPGITMVPGMKQTYRISFRQDD